MQLNRNAKGCRHVEYSHAKLTDRYPIGVRLLDDTVNWKWHPKQAVRDPRSYLCALNLA